MLKISVFIGYVDTKQENHVNIEDDWFIAHAAAHEILHQYLQKSSKLKL